MKKLFDKMTENIGLRIASVLIAGLLWIVIVNVSDPIAENVYSGVKVEILNAGEITDENMTYQILDNTDNISVTVVAKRSINDLLSKDNIRAYADMNDLNEADGTVKIHLETNKYNEKIESIRSKTEYLLVEIEPVQKKMLAITPVVNGEPSSGFITGDVVLDQNVVSIQGPESVISKIETATAEVSVTGMNNNISTTSSIRYYDAEGDQIEAGRITGNISAVSVNVEILATKTVPINFSTSGSPQSGYAVASVSSERSEVTIAGKIGVIAGINSINIPSSAIEVDGRSESFETEIDINKYLSDAVKLADSTDDGKTVVEVVIERMENDVLQIPKSNFTIKNIPDGQNVTIDTDEKTISVYVKGIPEVIDSVNVRQITGTINVGAYMSENELDVLEEGVISLPAQVIFPQGIELRGEQFTVRCKVENSSNAGQ
ncbi:MAG TPA: hypothetical protein DCG85_08600 [Lachnospiraceae bacterium]|nr:hypothetical protein [Lachnospiraceae bacterium]